MGGFFGVVSKTDCVRDLYYGTDYHSHLGTRRGGMAICGQNGFRHSIHDISNAQFRSKFESNIRDMSGNLGIGVISDYEDQPLIIGSHLGVYSIVTVSKINNLEALAAKAFKKKTTHFTEMSGNEINPTELIATLINQENSFEDGLRHVHEAIEGSCSVLLMTRDGVYASRDRFGRAPIVIGEKEGAFAVTMETSAFPNLGYAIKRYIGPGEVVFISRNGVETRVPAGDRLRICAFFWVYYGYPSSSYEGVNVELSRNRNGALLAREDGKIPLDLVSGIPDSGTGHAIGYSNASGVPYGRPFVKYTPTWPRSFMPQIQSDRDLVADMKLLPIQEMVEGKRILFCDDSIVRGTQIRNKVEILYARGAREVHMRSACPPLTFPCKYLNFSRSRSILDLAARRAIREIEGDENKNLDQYVNPESDRYRKMVETIQCPLKLTSLKYQKLENLLQAIGVCRNKVCSYCWTGEE